VSRAQRVIAAIVAVITAVLLIESYGAMVDAARVGGRAIPALWPLGTEALALAMEVSVLEAKRLGQRAVLWLSWVLLVASVALSTVLQVAVAPPTLVGYVTAGATPVWLLGSFAVLSLLYRSHQPSSPIPAHTQAMGLPATADAARAAGAPAHAWTHQAPSTPGLPTRPVPQPAIPADDLPARDRRPARVGQADDAVLLARARQLNASSLAARGRPISRDKLRAELGIGATRAERLLAQLDGQSAQSDAPLTGNGRPARPAHLTTSSLGARLGGPIRDGQRG
jgi:hypothetical protein